MDLFLIKKVAGIWIMPLPVLGFLLLIGLFFFIKGNKKRAITSQFAAIILLFFTSTPFFINDSLSQLERQYPQYDISIPTNYIVVLGCGHSNDGALPITAQLYYCSLERITEAVRLHQLNPDSKILMSGYGGEQPFSNAYMGKELAMSLGIKESSINIFEEPRDTESEAKAMAPILRDKPFALVTSASHMRRAVSLFEDQHLSPIPAPTGHLVKDDSRSKWWHLAPKSGNIAKSERWWYETMGAIHLAIRSWF